MKISYRPLVRVLKYKTPLGRFLFKIDNQRKYPVEIGLLKGKEFSKSRHKSIIHYSIDKAATQYIKNIIIRIGEKNGLVPIRFNDYAFDSTQPYFHELNAKEFKKCEHVFKPQGYVYSVFNQVLPHLKNLDQFNLILAVRDPRDVLVSYYYSMSYSHPLPPLGSSKRSFFLNRRESFKQMEIDEYVKHDSKRVFKIYRDYKDEMINKTDNIKILYYEDMINDFEGWLINLCESAELEIDQGLKNEFVEDFISRKVKEEDVYNHIRKGRPGDYKEKLSQETIMYLNREYGDLLSFYGYSK